MRSSPVGKLADETVEKVDGDTYGPLKALCEQAVMKALPGRATIIRPGLIVGPDDNTDRFTYWPARAARGGEFIAPGAPTDPFQIIDVRDLAAFTLNAVENNVTGTYNLVSNVNEFKFGELTDACIAAAKKQAKPADAPRATYLPTEFLEEQKVEPWSEMPVWLPAKGDEAAFAGTSNKAALAKGLEDHAAQEDGERHAGLAPHASRPKNARSSRPASRRRRKLRCSRRGRRRRPDVSSLRGDNVERWLLRIAGASLASRSSPPFSR